MQLNLIHTQYKMRFYNVIKIFKVILLYMLIHHSLSMIYIYIDANLNGPQGEHGFIYKYYGD